MLPSSPPEQSYFAHHVSVGGSYGPLSPDKPDFFDPDNARINYSYMVPTKVYVLWTTQQESRQGCWRSAFRKMVAYFSGGVTHIELAFEFTNNKIIAVAAYQNQPVQLFIKTPERGAYDQVYGKWDFEQLALAEHERYLAWNFCLMQYGKPYNARGLYSFIPCLCCIRWCCPCGISDGSSWFCSQLVVATIQYALQNNERLRVAAFMVEASQCRPDQTLTYLRQLELAEHGKISVLGNPKAQLQAWWKRETEKDSV